MISLILVDDDATVRRGLKMRLALEADLQIVGEADDGEQAVRLVQMHKPDVVVMDVVMPNLDGLAATKQIRMLFPRTSVIMLSLHSDATTRARAFAAGACAFVTKGENENELIPAIRQAYADSQIPAPAQDPVKQPTEIGP